ncbi:MAG: hypothetical protein Q4E49_00745 [Bacteroidales bacterium]|nr:hypothetical protein [Bacteroidales bacterium]
MKKYLSLFAFAMMAVFSLAFVSCGDDEEEDGADTSKLVGTWEIIKSVSYENGEVSEIENGYGAYWVFTNRTITIHDKYDLMNKQTIDYVLKDNKLHIAGFDVHTILELTSSKLVLKTFEIHYYNETTYEIITFKKKE